MTMAKGNKTVSVLFLLERANKCLASNFAYGNGATQMETSRAYRAGIASFIELVLHESGNYAGFGYLGGPYVAGVTDDTRRVYYYSEAMHKAKRERLTIGGGPATL
jgi:hypothetical protein